MVALEGTIKRLVDVGCLVGQIRAEVIDGLPHQRRAVHLDGGRAETPDRPGRGLEHDPGRAVAPLAAGSAEPPLPRHAEMDPQSPAAFDLDDQVLADCFDTLHGSAPQA